MMRWFPRSKLSPIGLDLGAHSFKAVQLRHSDKGWAIAAAVSLARAKPGVPLMVAEIERMRDVLDRRGFIGRDVVLAVPEVSVLSAILELPARAPGLPMEQIATAEFGRVHKLDPATVSTATWELPASVRASKATYLKAVGARMDQLDTHADLIEAGGLNVVAIDEPYSAAARGAMRGVPPAEGLTAVVDLGWDAARLAILHGGTVVYTRKLANAGFATALKAAADVTDDETDVIELAIQRIGVTHGELADADLADAFSGHVAAMLREISQAFGYAIRQYPDQALSAVRLVGGGATLPGLAERFTETLGTAACIAGDADLPAAMALAAGLAMFEGTR